ncbi:MAG: hypothetical protein WC820_00970 [Spirochaetales bacterium]|jgi:hypothetical protein
MEPNFLSAFAQKSAGELTRASGMPGREKRSLGLFTHPLKCSQFLDQTIISLPSIGLISLTISIISIISII